VPNNILCNWSNNPVFCIEKRKLKKKKKKKKSFSIFQSKTIFLRIEKGLGSIQLGASHIHSIKISVKLEQLRPKERELQET